MLPAQLGSLNPFPLKPSPTRQQTQDLRNLCWQQVVARNANSARISGSIYHL
jgi:hypothetical protein